MNRGTMKTLLSRRLNDQAEENWDNDILDTYLNLAYALVLKQVRKIDPEAVLNWEYTDTVAGTHFYEKPGGTRGPVEVGLKSSASDTDYTALKRKPYYIARDWTGPENVYCHRAGYIGIFPAPTVAVTQGIQFIHVPTATMAADSDVPRIEETLQLGVIIWAALLAKGESPEGDSKEARDLQSILQDVAADYGQIDYGQGLAINADVSDARGRGQWNSSNSNGTDNGRFI